ncbi:hypothetical protein ALP74_200517 [Pseudomonas coronafaciens pv. garcae]|uniref:Uncharacterized protein n=1 Tax=Pseudomonas coronafaciens pv. garcae TaxID=251653 RepID=A0AB37QUF4_9PSED|nr:hypothetical protein ALP74_200517 [Pseudomonas coronafaciens pv. garcae]
MGGADPATGGVQRQLADRNPHAADTLVAKAENSLAVGHHNDLDTVLGGTAQDVIDAVALRIGNEQAAMRAVNLGELLTRLPHCRRVDDRQHLVQMRIQQAEKQGLVIVLNRTQVNMLVQVARALFVLAVNPGDLLFDGFDVLRQQPDQIEFNPLLRGKGAAFVQQRHLQQRGTCVGNV